MQMSKIGETNNRVKESLPLETVSLGQKSGVLSQVTTYRQSATACLKKVNKKHLTTQRIATRNVRTLYRKDQQENVMKEMQRQEINILGLSEVKWTDTGSFDKNKDITLYGQVDKSMNLAFVLFLIAREKDRTRIIWLF